MDMPTLPATLATSGPARSDRRKTLGQWLASVWNGSPTQSEPELLDERALLARGERLRKTHGSAQTALSLALFSAPQLAELEHTLAPSAMRKLRRRLTRKLLALAGNSGLAGAAGEGEFAVMLPGMDERFAKREVRSHLGNPFVLRASVVARDGTPTQAVVQISCLTREIESDGRSLTDWLAATREELQRATRWASDRKARSVTPAATPVVHVAEHEAPFALNDSGEWQTWFDNLPPTVPAPLTPR